MKSFLFLAGAAGLVAAQGVTEIITPKTPTPEGCKTSVDGTFEITVVDIKAKRDLQPQRRAACGGEGILVSTLSGGVLKDALSRTGYIADNFQFQYDGPPQAGALITGGFSVCEGGVLALGGSKTFYKCQSGSFFNLYDRTWADHCYPVSIIVMPCGGNVAQISDGQIIGTTVVPTTLVTVLPDGQPQVVTTEAAIPVYQIGDGQVQVQTTAPTMTAAPVSQISDGQLQVSGPAGEAPPAETAPATAPAEAPTAPPASNATATFAPQPSVPAATSAPAAAGASSLYKSNAFGALVIGILGALLYL